MFAVLKYSRIIYFQPESNLHPPRQNAANTALFSSMTNQISQCLFVFCLFTSQQGDIRQDTIHVTVLFLSPLLCSVCVCVCAYVCVDVCVYEIVCVCVSAHACALLSL